MQEEFLAIMLPHHGQGRGSNRLRKHVMEHEAKAHPDQVPSEVSWANTGAGQLVTDQAVCGSCWAFATAAALQGAAWLHTGSILVDLMQTNWLSACFLCSPCLI